MQRLNLKRAAILLVPLVGIAGVAAGYVHQAPSPVAAATPDAYGDWPLLVNPFESTGGGGIMIDEYAPVVEGDTCRTNFTATPPGGPVYRNTITWTAVATQGGVLCKDGEWRTQDGSARGTTPFQVFIKDGVVRRMP